MILKSETFVIFYPLDESNHLNKRNFTEFIRKQKNSLIICIKPIQLLFKLV